MKSRTKPNYKKTLLIGGGIIAASVGVYFLARYIKNMADKPSPGGLEPTTQTPPTEGTTGGQTGGTYTKDTQIDPKPAGVPSDADLTSDAKLRQAFAQLVREYGKPIAQNAERIARLETGNFKSGGYKSTGAAGMVAAAEGFPYGWGSLSNFWNTKPGLKPIGVVRGYVKRENKIFPYLAFGQDSQGRPGGLWTLAEILKNRGNDPGKYVSLTNTAAQDAYKQRLAAITITYTV
jgi:hypothetical protein